MSTDLVLACHGQSAQRQGGKVLGWWADVPLSRAGHQQAILLGERLRDAFDVTALYTSPLRRARETAEVVGRLVHVVPATEQDLRELDGGELAGLTYDEARDRYPDLILHGRSAPGTRIPGGESYADLHMRVQHAVGRIVRQNQGGQVLVITHGGPIVAYLRAAMGFTWDAKGKPRFACDAISIHHLRFDEGGEKTVMRLNDTVHLSGMPG
ncbi:MAG: histidine phosphatase family protein [Candidatus Latescibacteria bacterium]|nr:histidine phosphatase family protein [Candidatus Latescibacterota bacterium]